MRGISLGCRNEQQGHFWDLPASFSFFGRLGTLSVCLCFHPHLLSSSLPPLCSFSPPVSFPAPAVGSQLSVSLPPSLTPYLPRALLGASGLLRRGRMSDGESPPAPSPPPPLLPLQRDGDGRDGPERVPPLSDTERETIQDTWGHVYKNCEDVGVSVLIR